MIEEVRMIPVVNGVLSSLLTMESKWLANRKQLPFGTSLLAIARKRFPGAAALLATPDADLRSAGLSRAKAAAVKDLAQHVIDHKLVPRRLPAATDAEVAAMLLPVRGIGPWSVDMFLMFALARPDILPVGDLGIRKGMQRHFGLRALPEADRMLRLAEPWRPFRTAASWYMWRLLDDKP